MTASGTLGTTQLLAHVNAASADAVRGAAKELGFAQVTVETGTVLTATEFLKQHPSPEILLIEVASADAAPAQLDALADVVNPHTKVIVCGPTDSYRFYHWLMDLGIHEYLLQPFTAEDLKQAIVKGAAKKTEAVNDGTPQIKKLIAVMGTRGGVGTSTVATNLGAIFAREHDMVTGIIDLDPYFGTIALGMDLEPGRGLRDAMEKPDRVDALFLERVMVKPFAPLSILSAEEPLSDPITPQGNAGEMIFTALREKFNMVVVDLPRQMNPVTRHVLATADHTVLVTEPQLNSLRDALRIKDYLASLKRPAPLVFMNRIGMSPKNELPAKDFIKHFGAEPVAKLNYLQEIIAATAQGELLISDPKLQTALGSLRSLALTISGKEEEEKTDGKPEKLSMLARLKAKK